MSTPRVAVIGFAQAPCLPSAGTTSGVETLVPVFRRALTEARHEVVVFLDADTLFERGTIRP